MSAETEDRMGMTEEQWTIFKRATSGFGDQDENGIDLSLLRENLKLTPTQRLEKMFSILKFHQEVRRAGIAAGLSGYTGRS